MVLAACHLGAIDVGEAPPPLTSSHGPEMPGRHASGMGKSKQPWFIRLSVPT